MSALVDFGSTVSDTSDITLPGILVQFNCLTVNVSAVKSPDTFNPSTSKSDDILPEVAFILPVILALVASIEPSDNILNLLLAVTNPSNDIFLACNLIFELAIAFIVASVNTILD